MDILRVLFLATSICILNTTLYAKKVSAVKVLKGEALITIEGDTHTLPLYTCYRVTNTFKGKPSKDLMIRTYKSRKSKELGPRFSAVGRDQSDKSQIFYTLSIKGGVMKGGADYKGQVSFEYLEGNTLHYKGKSKKRRMESGKLIKSVAPIEFTVTCK
jgi:hypothetical protein